MANIGDLVATATLDIAPFMNNTRNLKTYMRGLDNSLKAVENSFKGQGGRLNGLKAVYTETGSALKGYQGLLAKQTEHYNKLKDSIGNVDNATANQKKSLIAAKAAMMETAAKVVELQNRLKALATETSVFTRFGDVAVKVGSTLQNVGKSFYGVGAALTKGITAPIVAGAGYAIKAAVDYETAFAGVKKTVDEAVDSNGRVTVSYNDLSNGIRSMAKELPASASEIARVAETAGQLGIKAEDILGFTRTMIDMGESTNLSAEEAATAIAKIGNITGLTSSEYQNFGSAVVALGNNFATTEADIISMANRLAASGKLAGLTNQEILGLSAAMSSVGIEAEAGGTAMTQTLTAIESAATSGGSKLQKLSEIAGMTSDQFVSKWREKPIEALQSFIKGLGELDKKGESATAVLDELGMSGIRQSNMLKSLGLASETLGSAIETSNRAWKDNTALSDEASKRYETTQSKMEMLKNEVTDVAIEFGGPLVDGLRDAFAAGKPIIKMAADLAKKFSALDRDQQQQIINWGLIAAAAGPALSILGKGIGTIGSVVSGIGKVSKLIGSFSGYLKTFKTGATVATTSVEGLTNATGLLGTVLSPGGALITGTALLAGGMVLLANAKDKAREKAEEWGTTLSGQTTTELQQFKDKVDETTFAMVKVDISGTPALDNVKNAFSSLLADIETSHPGADKRLEELGKKFGLSQEQVDRGKARNVSQLTVEEKGIIENNQRELINAKLELMDLSNKQEMAVREAFSNDVSVLNETQLKKQMAALEKAMTAENKAYKKSKSELKELYENDALTKEEYNTKKAEAESNHLATMDALQNKYVASSEAADAKFKARTRDWSTNNEKYSEQAKKFLKSIGVSYDELSEKISQAASKGGTSMDLLAKSTATMSNKTKEANAIWTSLTFDEKNLKSNLIR